MEEIEIGSAATSGPGRTTGWLKLADYPDGSPMRSPVVILTGSRPGPTVWMHGCVHGNEYCGTKIIHACLRSLAAGDIAGRIVALPALNISAFNKGQRMSPFEGYNGGDMNRCFPGVEFGSLTQQMAYRVFRELKKHASVLIDFHTAHTPDVAWALYASAPAGVSATGETMARAWGYRDTLAAPSGMLAGSAMMTAAMEGIPAFIVEAGGKGPAFDPAVVDDGAERLRNVLRALGVLEGEVVDHGPIANFDDFAWIHAPRGGLFQPCVRCGETVSEGQAIGTFLDLYGEETGTAQSPKSGTVLAIHPGPVINNGDTLIHIGLNPRETLS